MKEPDDGMNVDILGATSGGVVATVRETNASTSWNGMGLKNLIRLTYKSDG